MAEPGFLIAMAVCAYVLRGLVDANREAAICRAENEITGNAAPVWPVWAAVTCFWPVLVAQRLITRALIRWDAWNALRACRKERRNG
ncbi:hypothetical protein [Hyphomonas sp.]|uniref:hypothetical protein n=1 Tax=Hyphomonas sp. TaxID=87 RepID=UPI00391A65E7